jgi:hypothetical protein
MTYESTSKNVEALYGHYYALETDSRDSRSRARDDCLVINSGVHIINEQQPNGKQRITGNDSNDRKADCRSAGPAILDYAAAKSNDWSYLGANVQLERH